ncbi:MAG: bifunctional 5,10-methylenetetrahydrofolate dehydrogenase/5,10-methenyltetrahydrofolate cyclohydrolase [Candidatus Omnitrophica bacterium]|nr:bifunctional 5,10-methylenetetrahydrofolate dehydrogenase/5,10-methenyltetrahydrofolate cyclohydrolase [Candidatus Omnitrophota bacterium]MBL7151390.1 bifunctional 5,10-methylenetetrahydrofolate dehydrogenase/5,10-methenyltetrahydrofolate cyclohydrolase [Candidatus Omnitrophota bacterium]MBL7210255.1 bifunctional 5,10-methylenetetrahydrofolate dehydrogenase/5,10-methenyltetrahydrofolate cyclohydrolase [Candidatus Omnitrophota bacterium]
MAKLLEGKVIAEKIKEGLRQEIRLLKVKPVLASVQAGENAGAEAYAKSQKKTAEDLGIEYQFHKLGLDTSENGLIEFIRKLNGDKSVNGIIIQMPLPPQIDYKKISQFIHPDKDVEGMHPVNIGKIVFAKSRLLPCTPAAVMELLNSCCADLYGKEAVIVGHSEIVGKPLALMLLDKFATVTVAHIGTSKAQKLEEHVNKAEILIVAVGKAGLIKGGWIKEGAIVIDVGINRVEGKIVGDVEFAEAEKRASYITPVPGGVGPLTVTMLMRNLVEAAKSQQ